VDSVDTSPFLVDSVDTSSFLVDSVDTSPFLVDSVDTPPLLVDSEGTPPLTLVANSASQRYPAGSMHTFPSGQQYHVGPSEPWQQ